MANELSLDKTEVALFRTKDTCERAEKECVCKADCKELKYNTYSKILGITLDEQLNFLEHVNKTEKKASNALSILREVKWISRISSKKVIELYVTLIISVIEYGCLV